MSQQNDYGRPKGPKELEYLKLSGKSQMRIGSQLRRKLSGLNREQMAEKLIEQYSRLRGLVSEGGSPADSEVVVHSFVLRPGRSVKLQLPADLTQQEAERLIKFIQILPAE